MKFMKRLLVALVLVMVLMSSVAFAADVPFSVANLPSSPWITACSPTRANAQWRVRIDSVTNHGVGQGFLPSGTWATALYTYNSNTTGWRDYKNYQAAASVGTTFYWKMRGDTDYSSNFWCSGLFRP